MDLAPTKNAITSQEYLSREDMSLVLHSVETDVITSFTAANQGTKNTKVVKSLNFVPFNKCYLKVQKEILPPDSLERGLAL